MWVQTPILTRHDWKTREMNKNVAAKVWMCQLSGNTWPLWKELGEICEWKMIEDEARGYIRESPLHRDVAGGDFLKALHG